MKTFSILALVFAVALMLVGNTADAQDKYEFSVNGVTGVALLDRDVRLLTFRLSYADGTEVPNPANIYVDFVAVGVDVNPRNLGPAALPDPLRRPLVDPGGFVTVQVEVTAPEGQEAKLTATPYPRSVYGVDATAYFQARKQDPVKLVVLSPQETQYSVDPKVPDGEGDGLLKDLPEGFEPHWLGSHWTDYCALGERDIQPEPQPIKLADGRRYHPGETVDASVYQNRVGDLFTAVVEIRGVHDLSAWQMDVAFNPQILKALRVREGKFLAKEERPAGSDTYVYDRINPFFLPGLIDNDVGVITGIAQARVGRSANHAPPPPDILTSPSPSGVSTGNNMAGILFCIDFQVLEFAEESLGLHNVQLSDSNGARLSYYSVINPVVVTHKFPAVDVNRDRHVDILDLMTVAGAMTPPDGDGGRNLGRANPINPRADVNDDGIINALDLIAVSSHPSWAKYVAPQNTRVPNEFVGPTPTAPALVGDPAALTPSTIQGWIDIAQVEDDGSAIFDLGIANLERLLQATVPERTKLLLNYPNPFNPETWIPYQLAKATDVSVSIYSVNGALVRTLALGHQAPGVYQSKSRAAYWDGRNELGERVASGVYFYTLTAGDFSATGKMLVRK